VAEAGDRWRHEGALLALDVEAMGVQCLEDEADQLQVLQTRRAVNQDVIKKTLAQTVAMAGALHS
jgi:pimeloyl-CoA synthetase